MIVVNFSHPLTEAQEAQIVSITGNPIERIACEMAQFDLALPLAPQVCELVDGVGFSAIEWQTLPIVLNLPGLATAAACILAELHGRMGYFPPILRVQPVPGTLPCRFEVFEVIDLLAVRDAARLRRTGR